MAQGTAAHGIIVCVIGGRMVKKADIVERVVEADMTRRVAKGAVGAVFAAIAGALARSEDATVAGFGKFSRKSRSGREGRNPCTGEPAAVCPSNTVSFRASTALKDALN